MYFFCLKITWHNFILNWHLAIMHELNNTSYTVNLYLDCVTLFFLCISRAPICDFLQGKFPEMEFLLHSDYILLTSLFTCLPGRRWIAFQMFEYHFPFMLINEAIVIFCLYEISWMFKCIFVIMSDESDASLQTNWPTILFYTKTRMWWWCLALAQMLMGERENIVGIKKYKSRDAVFLIGQGYRSMH